MGDAAGMVGDEVEVDREGSDEAVRRPVGEADGDDIIGGVIAETLPRQLETLETYMEGRVRSLQSIHDD